MGDLSFERGQKLDDLRAAHRAVDKEERHHDKPAIADICCQVKLCWMIGLCPRQPQARVSAHFSESPDRMSVAEALKAIPLV